MQENNSKAFPDRYFGDRAPDRLPTVEEISAMAPYKNSLINFIQELPKEARLLDVGCGKGKAIRLIQALRPDVRISGMDITDMRPFLSSDIDFKVGSVDELTSLYERDSFDAVICQHVIEHLVSPIELLKGFKHVLVPGGRVYLETPNWTRLIVPFSHLYFWNDYTHIRPYGVVSANRLFFDFGFQATAKTVSSCQWFPRHTPSATKSEKGEKRIVGDGRGPLSRLVARLINPVMRDTLIVIALKPEA